MAPKLKRKTRNKLIRKDNNNKLSMQNVKREKLFHELKFSALNTERNQRFWRETLIRVKMPDVWRKIDVTWQTLEHAIDFKDYSISLLLDSLQEAQNQHRTINGAHVELIDKSLEAHETRLADVNTLFYGNVKTVLADKISQFENINYYRNKKEIALRKINLLVSHRGENASNIARSTAISKINAFMEDGDNEKRIIITQLQKKLENLWTGLRNIFSDYRKNTEDRRKDYEIIKKKDQIDQQMITRQYMRIAILFDRIMKFRSKINSYKKESMIELREITRESNFFHNIYRETNERFIFGCKKDKHKTTTMSKEYNRGVKHMRGLLIKAERILGYMQICRKYETQDEKILPMIDNHPMRLSITDDNDVLPLQTVTTQFTPIHIRMI
ncbi:dynein regulatory complex subunit 2 [Frieseomelitta varia]|uniref:dynein regulatory complex subunit 2 n=1 Tax=Frieseomelitta varia TaxID=561572 RepID=UPI001CB6A669|nr:dynein regulatory complex subunit 2 [Frieseomelitta varia]XP_043524185.1 dynein regulatory complex subunit 2 [Frieseomelitta varia]XP_043524186.1 dynein regulatory complex subunit 2 [Frieseomelitta varia]XP_043524187.1 dynein regulatory complex subunit 2 [Frieseomelitta varia]